MPFSHPNWLHFSMNNESTPTVCVIIINYNGASFLTNCLDSVIAQRTFFNDVSIIVLDNASTDESVSILNQYAEDITLVKNNHNNGFAPAVNQVLPMTQAPYLWLLNNDTEFNHDTDILTPIIDYFNDHNDVVGLSPKLLNTNGTLQAQGSSLNAWLFKSSNTRQVSFLSGAALFVRTDFFKYIGGFDEQLVFYNDDIDFAKQVRHHNKKLIYYPSIEVTHHGGLSTKFRPIDSIIDGYRGSLHLCKKFYSPVIFYIYLMCMRFLIQLRLLYYAVIPSKHGSEWSSKLKEFQQFIHDQY